MNRFPLFIRVFHLWEKDDREWERVWDVVHLKAENLQESDKRIETALVSIVDNAVKSLENGNDDAAIGQLQAFIRLVEAQRGKTISEEAADMLIEYATNVIAKV